LMHKKMLRVAGRIASAPKRRSGSKAAEELATARDFLQRAQCNDAYWHGIFGGLYAPHLRTDISRNLIRAEAIADRHTPNAQIPRVEELDYDGDGVDELLFTAPQYQALVKPSDGGTLAALDFRPTDSTLINSILRRPEPYHARLQDPNYRPATSTAAAYEQTKVKEMGLDRFLLYDRWPRHTFRIFLFDPSRTPAEYEALKLQEDAGFAAGVFTVESSSSQSADLRRHGNLARTEDTSAPGTDLSVVKHLSFGPAPRGCEIACELRVKFKHRPERRLAIGLESVVNLLAPNAADRFFETPEGPQSLRFTGALPGPTLRMEDGWQRVKIALHAPGAQQFWIAPIETVSESEEGFERVYQGSQILAVWYPDFANNNSWLGRLVWRVEEI